MSGALEKLLGSKVVVITVLVVPGVWPVVPMLVLQDPSVLADPPKYLLLHLGFTASCVLAAVLLMTPLRTLFPRWRPAVVVQRHRRLIGVSAFVYAVLHVTMHFIYEGGFGTFATDWKKPFILVGVCAFVILATLAVTSLNSAVRWLGARKWKLLHRLVYVAAALVVYHQISAKKVFPMEVVWVFGPLLLFEGARIWKTAAARQKRAA